MSLVAEPPSVSRRSQRHLVSVAPMMDRTDRHFRYLLRQVTRRSLLYTEMIHARAVLHGHRERLLAFDPLEHPLALQLGGDDPAELAEAARIAVAFGYDEVNLNVGCPSERVTSGNFGACLMRTPAVVAKAVAAMRQAVPVPVTVKHRIGVDDLDTYQDMRRFVLEVAEAGADAFTVHARKAWLHGLSPKENREVPPLRYDDVYRLKLEAPSLTVELNGGVRDLDQVRLHVQRVDGVMLGRAVVDDPFVLERVDAELYGEPPARPSRERAVRAMLPYVEARRREGVPLMQVARPMLTLFRSTPGAKTWRRYLSQHGHASGAGPEVLERALDAMLAEATAVSTRRADLRRTRSEAVLGR